MKEKILKHTFKASAPEEDARLLASSDVPSAAAIGVRDLAFSYLGMSDDDTYKVKQFFKKTFTHFWGNRGLVCRSHQLIVSRRISRAT